MITVGYLVLAVAAAALAVALIRSAHRARAREAGEAREEDPFEEIVAGLRSGKLARDPHILDNAPPERWTDR